jgi:hypothetical protein
VKRTTDVADEDDVDDLRRELSVRGAFTAKPGRPPLDRDADMVFDDMAFDA